MFGCNSVTSTVSMSRVACHIYIKINFVQPAHIFIIANFQSMIKFFQTSSSSSLTFRYLVFIFLRLCFFSSQHFECYSWICNEFSSFKNVHRTFQFGWTFLKHSSNLNKLNGRTAGQNVSAWHLYDQRYSRTVYWDQKPSSFSMHLTFWINWFGSPSPRSTNNVRHWSIPLQIQTNSTHYEKK